MFTPKPFVENDPDVIAAMIDRVGLAVLVTHGPEGLLATHVPVLNDGTVFLTHLARQNPHRDRAGTGEGLLIFAGPDAYVSPGWYPSKAEHGRAVPTWNYEAVHVYAGLSWFDDRDRLLDVVDRLSCKYEAGRDHPWSVDDPPAGFIDQMLHGIVGLELRVTRIEAKRKLSQNRSSSDLHGVISGLAQERAPSSKQVAELIRIDLLRTSDET